VTHHVWLGGQGREILGLQHLWCRPAHEGLVLVLGGSVHVHGIQVSVHAILPDLYAALITQPAGRTYNPLNKLVHMKQVFTDTTTILKEI